MVESAEAVVEYTRRGEADFASDRVLRDAVSYQIVVLGEAAKAVIQADPAIAESLVDIEWSLLARMRDRLTHQYWRTDPDILWSTALNDIPVLLKKLRATVDRIANE